MTQGDGLFFCPGLDHACLDFDPMIGEVCGQVPCIVVAFDRFWRGLAAEAVIVEARILAAADVTEAMTAHRPYRPALGLDATLAEIETGKGRLYDLAAVDACVDLFRNKGCAHPMLRGRSSRRRPEVAKDQ